MHLTVINIYFDITCIRTCERALCNLVHDTLEDSRHETCINCTTNNTVVVFELTAPLEWILFLALDVRNELEVVNFELGSLWSTLYVRLNEKVNLTELTCTT